MLWQALNSQCEMQAPPVTLLDGARAAGRITGDIRVNGFPWERRSFARISGYVEQTDVNAPKVRLMSSVTPCVRALLTRHIIGFADTLRLLNTVRRWATYQAAVDWQTSTGAGVCASSYGSSL